MTILRQLFKDLNNAGFTPYALFDGEEINRSENQVEHLNDIENLEEAWLYIKKNDNKVAKLYLVPDGPKDLLSDYSFFTKAEPAHQAELTVVLNAFMDHCSAL